MTTAARPRRRARRGEGERLRDEILVAARELLAETQDADAVSVRSVAERVGVSTPSIYLHFADKQALLDAVCEAVFADLDEHMQTAAATTDDPFDGLRLRGMAYARFALDNPEQYRIAMMTLHSGDHSPFDAEDIVAGPTYRHIVEAVQECVEVGVFAEGTDPRMVATSLWAAAHGAVSLCMAKPGLVGDQAMQLCELVITQSGLGAALWTHLGHPDHGGDQPQDEHASADLAAMMRGLSALHSGAHAQRPER